VTPLAAALCSPGAVTVGSFAARLQIGSREIPLSDVTRFRWKPLECRVVGLLVSQTLYPASVKNEILQVEDGQYF